MGKTRLNWIDAAKGVAIVLVVLGHVIASYQNAGQYKDSTIFNFSNQFVYSFHMATFMVISGILLCIKPMPGGVNGVF